LVHWEVGAITHGTPSALLTLRWPASPSKSTTQHSFDGYDIAFDGKWFARSYSSTYVTAIDSLPDITALREAIGGGDTVSAATEAALAKRFSVQLTS